MNDEAAFLTALRADPADATLLLVYADWLEERGDPRAEYIRLLQAPEENETRIETLRRQIEPAWAALIDGCCEKIGTCIQAEVLRIDKEWREEKSDISKYDSVTIAGRTLDVTLMLAFVAGPLLMVWDILFFGVHGGNLLAISLNVGLLAVAGVVFGRLCIVLPVRRFLMERRYRRAWRAYRQRRTQVRDWLPPPPPDRRSPPLAE
jgi:uncharacterized protein (TIGR02996 family)